MTRITTTSILEGQGRLEHDVAEVHVVRGPDSGLSVELGTDSLRIGTAPECAIVLTDDTISSRHAEIIAHGTGYSIRDLRSKNGIFVDAWQIERAPLVAGMKLRMGNTTLEVRALGGRKSIPLADPGQFGRLVAHSPKMRALVDALRRVAPSDLTVLIEGESGSGKEVAVQALHEASARATGPLVVFDCGAVPADLIASELFGHERGAFSGADKARPGLFEEAQGGTLFLDEIGELPLALQPVLLRAIATRRTRRVGGRNELEHDVRVVAATNRNLAAEVKANRFREDLFFRLAVVRVRMPPLRERVEDIPILAQLFAQEHEVALTPELLTPLCEYQWPGNVRELRSTIARAAVLPPGALGSSLVPSGERAARALAPLQEARRAASDEFERDYLMSVLAQANGKVAHAAKIAGVSRQLLTRLLARHGLRGENAAKE